jgi:hypothetical protein
VLIRLLIFFGFIRFPDSYRAVVRSDCCSVAPIHGTFFTGAKTVNCRAVEPNARHCPGNRAMQDNTAEDLLAFFDNAQLNSRYWITFAVMSAVVMFDFFDFLVSAIFWRQSHANGI